MSPLKVNYHLHQAGPVAYRTGFPVPVHGYQRHVECPLPRSSALPLGANPASL